MNLLQMEHIPYVTFVYANEIFVIICLGICQTFENLLLA